MLLDKKLIQKIKSSLNKYEGVLFEYNLKLTMKYIYNECISTNKDILVVTNNEDVVPYVDVGREVKVIQQDKFNRLDCNADEEMIKKYFGELTLIMLVDLEENGCSDTFEITEKLASIYGEHKVKRIAITQGFNKKIEGYEVVNELEYKRKVVSAIKFLSSNRSMPTDEIVKYFNNYVTESEIVTILNN